MDARLYTCSGGRAIVAMIASKEVEDDGPASGVFHSMRCRSLWTCTARGSLVVRCLWFQEEVGQ